MGLSARFNYPPEAVKSGKTRLYKISIYYTLICENLYMLWYEHWLIHYM